MSALAATCPLSDLLAEPRPAAWQGVREAAEARLARQELPTTRDEDWKYLDLSALAALPLKPGQPVDVSLEEHILPETRGTRMVFVNGHYDEHHSNTSALPPGVRMLRLAQAYDAAAALGTLANPETNDFFANLNSARFTDGVLVFVPRHVRVDVPLHVVFASKAEAGSPTCSLARVLVLLEPGAELTLVEEYLGSGPTLTNAVVEVKVAEGATLFHDRIQRESPEGFHFATLAGDVRRDARYECRTLTFGGRLSRQHPQVHLAAERAHLELHGLALIEGGQVADTHSFIDHAQPDCASRQLHKTVVGGAARAIFNGKVFVAPGAQKTDAQQASRNLLLSDGARVDTKPELEIFADDVKCTHGAAIGALDAEELFYLRSRGFREQDAQNLLTYGFASEVIASVAVPSLRKQLRELVLARTERA